MFEATFFLILFWYPFDTSVSESDKSLVRAKNPNLPLSLTEVSKGYGTGGVSEKYSFKHPGNEQFSMNT